MKRKMCMLLTMLMIASAIFSTFALAAGTNVASGFYNIGSKENVTITPYATNRVVTGIGQDIDGDEDEDTWYVNSNRMKVTYTVADDEGYYGVLLVEGRDLPTVDNTIFYIDQVVPKENVVEFDVYPLLPTSANNAKEITEMTLYISCSKPGASLISIPLSYVVGEEAKITYTLGDVDNDGVYGVKDALIVLQIGVQKYQPTEAERAAADVDGDGICGVKDALLILQYGTGKIDSFR
ncbi:MAG: dockerin type I repeat-containing protein [Clostridia bacterium]|nr:dockerin type I repeat-containing protein [Clostridia bacterium]